MLSAFTPRTDLSYLQALVKFDSGHLTDSAALLDRAPLVRLANGIAPRLCLAGSEQLLLRLLIEDKMGGSNSSVCKPSLSQTFPSPDDRRNCTAGE